MNNIEPKYGVTLYHLKDKFAYGSTTGNEISEFKYDENQAAALFNFLYNGTFDGMFDILSLHEYRNFAELNFVSLARDEMNEEVRHRLSKEYADRVCKLLAQKEKGSSEAKEPQAE